MSNIIIEFMKFEQEFRRLRAFRFLLVDLADKIPTDDQQIGNKINRNAFIFQIFLWSK